MPKPGWIKVQVVIREQVWKRVKMTAVQHDLNASQIVRRGIQRELDVLDQKDADDQRGK